MLVMSEERANGSSIQINANRFAAGIFARRDITFWKGRKKDRMITPVSQRETKRLESKIVIFVVFF